MDLKIRLSEHLDARLRSHAQTTGATLNSIVCLAIDSFIPGGSSLATVAPASASSGVAMASKQQTPPPPTLSPKPTKDEKRKLAAWYSAQRQGVLPLNKS